MLRTGIVQEGRGGQVRVLFEDEDIVSPWLDVAVSETRGTRAFNRPRPGNLVRVMMDENAETGVVIGAIYSEADSAPVNSDSQFVVIFGDGTRIDYDEDAGKLSFENSAGFSFEIVGTTLSFTGDLVVEGNVQVDGDLAVEGQTTLGSTTINGIPQSGT